MIEKNRLTVREVAKLMDATEQFVRIGLQQGKLPFGFALQMTGKRWTYFISKQKFTEYTGIKV